MEKEGSNHYQILDLFESFVEAVELLVTYDKQLFGWKRNRLPIAHRLALYLQETLLKGTSLENEHYSIDMAIPILKEKKALTADILIHDRDEQNPTNLLAVVCKDRYLTEAELLSLHALKVKADCSLVLAVTIFEDKEYMLIYRSGESFIDYYHFTYADKKCTLLKRRVIEGKSYAKRQLKLPIKV
ncbi:MAG: hypothetical protein WDA17_03175 [Sphaerochaetaceae bacterium]